jgi:hypothetical protein
LIGSKLAGLVEEKVSGQTHLNPENFE